jgi:hypothetical protein
LYGDSKTGNNVLILNSISMRSRALAHIKAEGYKEVYTYFDNDKGGEDTFLKFKDGLEGVNVVACNGLYEGFKDFNEFLVKMSITDCNH